MGTEFGRPVRHIVRFWSAFALIAACLPAASAPNRDVIAPFIDRRAPAGASPEQLCALDTVAARRYGRLFHMSADLVRLSLTALHRTTSTAEMRVEVFSRFGTGPLSRCTSQILRLPAGTAVLAFEDATPAILLPGGNPLRRIRSPSSPPWAQTASVNFALEPAAAGDSRVPHLYQAGRVADESLFQYAAELLYRWVWGARPPSFSLMPGPAGALGALGGIGSAATTLDGAWGSDLPSDGGLIDDIGFAGEPPTGLAAGNSPEPGVLSDTTGAPTPVLSDGTLDEASVPGGDGFTANVEKLVPGASDPLSDRAVSGDGTDTLHGSGPGASTWPAGGLAPSLTPEPSTALALAFGVTTIGVLLYERRRVGSASRRS